jgi:hypothetical protein
MRFSCDASEIDRRKYVHETHPPGVRRHVMKRVNPAALEWGCRLDSISTTERMCRIHVTCCRMLRSVLEWPPPIWFVNLLPVQERT